MDQVGWGELVVLMVIALFVFGPDRLPGLASDAGTALRKVRLYVKSMTADLKTQLGPEVGDLDLASLHPRTFVQKHLFSDADDEPLEVGGLTVPQPGGEPLRPGEPAPWDSDAT